MANMRRTDAPAQHCPIEATLDVIGGNWKVVILFWLMLSK